MKKKNSEKGQGLLIALLVLAIVAIIMYGAYLVLKGAIEALSEGFNNYQNTRPAQSLVFAGKVVNVVTGDWPNDRLILLFLNGEEIARTKSTKTEFPESNEGIQDGSFILQTANSYNLRIKDFNFQGNQGLDFSWKNNDKWFFSNDNAEIYRWFGDVEEDTLIYISLPAKNLKFAIYVFDVATSNLPAEVLTPGSAVLKHDGKIYVNEQPIH